MSWQNELSSDYILVVGEGGGGQKEGVEAGQKDHELARRPG